VKSFLRVALLSAAFCSPQAPAGVLAATIGPTCPTYTSGAIYYHDPQPPFYWQETFTQNITISHLVGGSQSDDVLENTSPDVGPVGVELDWDTCVPPGATCEGIEQDIAITPWYGVNADLYFTAYDDAPLSCSGAESLTFPASTWETAVLGVGAVNGAYSSMDDYCAANGPTSTVTVTFNAETNVQLSTNQDGDETETTSTWPVTVTVSCVELRFHPVPMPVP